MCLVQNPNQSNVDNLKKNLSRESSRHSGNKKKGISES